MKAPRPILPSKTLLSPRGVGFMLAAAIAVLTPVHFVVSCGESSAVAAAALGLLAATFFLCLKTPEGTIGRFDPLAFAFGACILNILALH